MRWAGLLAVPIFGVTGDFLAGYATGRIPAARDELVKAVVITVVVALAVLLAVQIRNRRNG